MRPAIALTGLVLMGCQQPGPQDFSSLEGWNASLKDALSVDDLSAGDLVITEIMFDPAAVGDGAGEWFEIYNNTGGTVDLDGLQIFDTSESSPGDEATVSGTVLVASGDHAVFGRYASRNGGVTLDYAYGTAHTLHDFDEIFLANSSGTLDSVAWDNGTTFPDPTGASISLDSAAQNASDNDNGNNWCAATSSFGDGDLGTPGASNDDCEAIDVDDLSAGDLVITEIMVNPDAVGDGAGEWFEVYNNTSDLVDLDGLEIFDTSESSPGDEVTVSGRVPVASGGYAVMGRHSSRNGGVTLDYAYGTDHTFHAYDELFLANSGGTLDSVVWDNGLTFPDPTGASISLDSTALNTTDNDDGSKWCAATSSFGDGDLGTPGADNDTCSLPTTDFVIEDLGFGDLVINEIMFDPDAVGDGAGEWFEIYNNSGGSVDLDGLQIFDTSESSPGDHVTVSGSVEVDAEGYAVLGRHASGNGGVTLDYAYGTDHTLHDFDEIFLANSSAILDSVAWDNGLTFPDPTGASLSLDSDARNTTENDDGSKWCAATASFGDGDLGTPGEANDLCADIGVDDLSAGDLVITEIMFDPAAVGDGAGEWFEIYNNTGGTVDLDGLQIFDTSESSPGDEATVSGTVLVASGDHAVFGRYASRNGGVTLDYAYGTAHTLHDFDEIFLANSSGTLDSVAWDNGTTFPDPTGASISLDSAAQNASDNDNGNNWCAATSSFGDGDLGTPGASNDDCEAIDVDDLSAGDLVITEIMVNPDAVGDGAGEWFEVYNNTSDLVDLDGLEIFDTSESSPGDEVTVSGRVPVASGGYAVMGRHSSRNGGVTLDYAYGTDHTFHAYDELFLANSGGTLDSVVWDNGLTFPDPTGASISLDSTALNTTDNDDGSKWCAATSSFGDGDLGTPGADNDTCSLPTTDFVIEDLGFGDLVINEIMFDPDAVGDGAGEWFEIYNNSGGSVDLDGLQIFDTSESSPGDHVTVSGSVEVDAEGYAVLGRHASGNGGVTLDYAYGTDHTLHDFDEIFLANSSAILDSVAWDNGLTFPDPTGASIILDTDAQNATDNDDGANWCTSAALFGDGDMGTPVARNDSCVNPDADGDGFGVLLDCEDYDASINPDTPEVMDDVDNNCDGYVDAWFVCQDGTGDWSTLQDGLDNVDEGGLLVVCPGTYSENIVLQNKDVSVLGSDGADVTIVDGGETDVVWRVINSDDVSLEGLTLQGGSNSGGNGGVLVCSGSTLRLTESHLADGVATNGGLFMASNCDLEVTDNTFSEGEASDAGGGVYLSQSEGTFADNEVTECIAYEGGGVFVYQGDVSIDGNSIHGNTALAIGEGDLEEGEELEYSGRGSGGGGLFVYGDSPVTHNTISDNDTTHNGGGVYLLYGDGDFEGNTVSDNYSAEDGGGLYTNQSSNWISGNLFQDNDAADDAGGVRIYVGTTVIEDNIFEGNTCNDDGGGLKMSHSYNTLRRNEFYGNEAGDAGGGLELDNDTTDVEDCYFEGNRALRGAGLHSWWNEGNINFDNLTFFENEASDCGGGLSLDNDTHTVSMKHLVFVQNKAVDGAAICVDEIFDDHDDDVETEEITYESVVEIYNSLFIENDAGDDAGAIYLKTASSAVIENITVWENSGNEGTALALKYSTVVVRNSIFSENSGNSQILVEESDVTFAYNDVWGSSDGFDGMDDPTGDNGNLDEDPDFEDPSEGDFTLSGGSPCVNSGSPFQSDPDGSRADMGAYGGSEGDW